MARGVVSEKKIEETLTKHVKSLGGMCLKLLPFQVKGLPDRMVLLPQGKVIFIELKSSIGKPSKVQEYMLLKIKNLGFETLIINSINQIYDINSDRL